MTLCEFYRNQFEQAKNSKWFNADSEFYAEKFGKGSYKWFKEMAKTYFGGGFAYKYEAVGITFNQLHDAREKGYIKYVYDSSWLARQLHHDDWYGLTEKGLKTLYGAYSDWE